MKTIKDLCDEYGYSQTRLAKRFGIPLRTVQDWHGGRREPAPYLVPMMEEILKADEWKEKQLPKPIEEYMIKGDQLAGYCPTCSGTVLFHHRSFPRKVKGACCSWCGQRLEWSTGEEDEE